MVELNGFRMTISPCISEDAEGYVTVEHGQQYAVRLFNRHKEGSIAKPCDVEISIDGEPCGIYRLDHGQNILLERPEHSTQRFTAYKKNSIEARQSKIDTNSSEMGLICAVFKPGTKKRVSAISSNPWIYRYVPPQEPYRPPMPSIVTYGVGNWDTLTNYSNNSSMSYTTSENTSRSFSKGLIGVGTGLSGESNQTFTEVDELDYDENSTTIYLRLIAEEKNIKPLAPRKVYSTKVPRPL